MPAAIVLAGGLSTRLGRDKVFLEMEGRTLLERVVARLSSMFRDILVVTSQRGREGIEKRGLQLGREISLITDLYPSKGSLGGIYSGLAMSPASHNLVVACDMPFLNERLLAYMIQQMPDFDVIIPRLEGVLEPLHAIYSKSCLGPMKSLLDNDHLKIIDLFPQMRVRYIEEEEITPLDPQRLSFFNINTTADFQRAQELEASLRVGN
ncbi:MAG: molybdenum cofactor guanylyltransferase [Dehalococcoidia bacterium]|nr:molybdenum cofactor guanylyltransferase [Dehalococcoidia bacterium]